MRRLLPALLACALLLSGCAGSRQDAAADYAPDQAERLVLYTSHKAEVYEPIVREFQERTGIWVEVVSGGTNELLERIRREQDAPRADVMFGGGVESLSACADLFSPYRCAGTEAVAERYRCAGDLWTPFSALPAVLIYNTKLAEPGAVTGWADLLSPELAGSIAFADPQVSGSAYTALVTLTAAAGGDWEDVLRRFARNLDGRQLKRSGEVLTAVAQGSCTVGVTLEETALQRMAAGDDIAIVYPADGTSAVPDGSALVRGAPHEDNAKRFLDFTVERDVQRRLAQRFYRRSVRTDVDTLADLPDLDELPLLDYDTDWASDRHDAVLMTWAFYLGGEEEGE